MNAEALFSSASGEWGTDPGTFERYRRRWGLNIDLAASAANAKLLCYCDRARNILATDPREVLADFTGLPPGEVRARGWLNPIYGDPEEPCRPRCTKKRCRPHDASCQPDCKKHRGHHVTEYQPGIIDFMRRGRELTESRVLDVCCCLVPARVDTGWWWETVHRPAGALLGVVEPGPGVVRRHYAGLTIEVEFLEGRESFLNEAGEKQWSAPFPSAVVTFVAP